MTNNKIMMMKINHRAIATLGHHIKVINMIMMMKGMKKTKIKIKMINH